jgi:hypothetical protein
MLLLINKYTKLPMKFLLILFSSFSITAFAQDKIFLECEGIFKNSESKTETAKADQKSVFNEKVNTEIVIDRQSKSISTLHPLANICEKEKPCDCSFDMDSFNCTSKFDIGTTDSYIYSTESARLDVRRKSGIAVYSYYLITKISNTQSVTQTISSKVGQLQCKTITKNRF